MHFGIKWEEKVGENGLFMKEIKEQRRAIKKILEEMGIDHGHPHNENFSLRFYRTESGEVDLSRPPRVYIIDFDEAKVPKKKN